MNDLIRRMDAIQACQVGPSDEWARATKDGYNQAATDCQRNILRIEPAPNAGAVKVKPLVWEEIAPHHSKAPLPLFGSIRAESWGGDFSVVWSVPGMCDTFTRGKWSTLDDAKAAAQADYDARILSAIELTPDPRDAVIARLVEALEAAKALHEQGLIFASLDLITSVPKLRDAAIAATKEVMG